MNTMYILVCDVDDTLTGDREGLNLFNKVISAYREHFYVVYSSGRFKESLLSVIERERLMRPDAITCNVGTELYYSPFWNKDEEWENIINSSWNKHEIASLLSDLNIEPQPFAKQFVLSYYVEDNVEQVKNRLQRRNVKIIHTKERYLDIFPERAGKGNAALYVKNKLQLPLICCGDSENDEDMIRKSDYGIVVKNACKKLKKKSANFSNVYIASSPHAQGVIEGLQVFRII